MGFPVGYTEVLVPTTFLRLLTFLASLRSLVLSLFRLLGLSELLLLDTPPLDYSPSLSSAHDAQQYGPVNSTPTLSSLLIREFLPSLKFRDLPAALYDGEPCCAVCLTEFGGEEEVRPMANCRHVFHMGCVDRWMDHDQRTCPLCRTPFVPDHRLHEYNQRLLEASDVSEFYAE